MKAKRTSFQASPQCIRILKPILFLSLFRFPYDISLSHKLKHATVSNLMVYLLLMPFRSSYNILRKLSSSHPNTTKSIVLYFDLPLSLRQIFNKKKQTPVLKKRPGLRILVLTYILYTYIHTIFSHYLFGFHFLKHTLFGYSRRMRYERV